MLIRNWKLFVFIGTAIAIIFSSCNTLNKNRMLKTPKDFVYQPFPDSSVYEQYKIAPDDILQLRIYSNDGFKAVNFSNNGNNNLNNTNNNGNYYRVNSLGNVKIPVIGDVAVQGLNVIEAEKLFEDRLSKYFNNPFVIIEITNKRVFVFKGGSTASVVNIQNENTTLFEVLAMTGGIDQNGNASKIKLIRGDLKNPTIHIVDLSTIEGMKNADLVMQANDIIYIDPFYNYAQMITSDLSTLLSLVSTILLTVNLASR